VTGFVQPSIRMDLEDIDDGFDAMKRRARDLRSVWRKFEPIAKQDQKETARLAEGPDKQKWEPLARTTASKRLRRRQASARRNRKRVPKRVTKKPLGRLPRQAQFRFNRDTFLARSRVKWSGIHQDGGVAGKGARIPARTHVYFSDDSLERLRDMLAEHVARAF